MTFPTELAPADRATPPPPPRASVFEVENLVVHYGKFVALPGLTLRCPPGAVGLLGPNGAGKSTLLKALLGLLTPRSGTVTVLGRAVPREAKDVRRHVGYMPEGPSVFPGLTGFESVAYAGLISGMPAGEARRRAHEVLEYAGVGEERYRKAEGYSAGMLQRIKLASALVHDPDLLFLDEPTNGLDPRGRIDFLELVQDLTELRGLSVILSSHLLRDVEHVCTSVVVLSRGTLRTSGVIADLKSRISGSKVRLTGAGETVPYLAALRERGWPVEPLDPLDPSDFVVTLPPGVDARELVALGRDHGCQIRRFVPKEASLEEVFLSSLDEGRGG